MVESSLAELATLAEAADLLRRADRACTAPSLYARIRRGTLYAVKVGRRWYVPRTEVKRLVRRADRQAEGGPGKRSKATRVSFEFPDDETIARLAKLTVAKRGRAQLEASAFLRGTIRARLRRIYPELSRREITFKMFEELAKRG